MNDGLVAEYVALSLCNCPKGRATVRAGHVISCVLCAKRILINIRQSRRENIQRVRHFTSSLYNALCCNANSISFPESFSHIRVVDCHHLAKRPIAGANKGSLAQEYSPKAHHVSRLRVNAAMCVHPAPTDSNVLYCDRSEPVINRWRCCDHYSRRALAVPRKC